MPIGSGLFDAVNKLTALKPPVFQAPTALVNNATSKNVSDPGVQARAAVATDQPAGAQQVTQLGSSLNDLNDWSKQITNTAQSAALARRAKQAADEAAAKQQQAKAYSVVPTSNVVAQNGVQTVSNKINLSNVQASPARTQLVQQASSLLGTPYAWGGGGYGVRSSRGTGLGTQNVIGVDCSGLTSYVYGTLGIKLPRTSQQQLTTGFKTNVNNLRPGDLVGWVRGNGGHVAMYVGNGQIIESPHVGATVRVRSLNDYDASGGVYGVHLNLPGDS